MPDQLRSVTSLSFERLQVSSLHNKYFWTPKTYISCERLRHSIQGWLHRLHLARQGSSRGDRPHRLADFPDQHNLLRPVVVRFDDQLSGGESESDAGTASQEWREH